MTTLSEKVLKRTFWKNPALFMKRERVRLERMFRKGRYYEPTSNTSKAL